MVANDYQDAPCVHQSAPLLVAKCTPGSKVGCIGIQISVICHVAASSTWLATTFLFYKQVIAALCSAAAPIRKRSRSVRLFACKRTHNGSLSLPTFCGQVRYQHSYHQRNLFCLPGQKRFLCCFMRMNIV